MSSVKIKGDTSGDITIAAPDIAGVNTLTLPAATGTLLTTDGDGSALTGISSTPSSVAINRTITGATTIRRAVSIATDGTVGTLPVIGTIGTKILTGANPTSTTVPSYGIGNTKIRTVIGETIASDGTVFLDVYGSYIDGAGLWQENPTPYRLNHIAGAASRVNSHYGGIGYPLPEVSPTSVNGQFVAYVSAATNDIVPDVAAATYAALRVAGADGAVTLLGSEVKQSYSVGGATTAEVNFAFRFSMTHFRIQLVSAGLTETYETYFNGTTMVALGTSSDAIVAQSPAQYVHYGNYNYIYSSVNSAHNRLWILDPVNRVTSVVIDATGKQQVGVTTISIQASDYSSSGWASFIDQDHIMQYYKNTSNKWIIRTFSILADAVTLIDTKDIGVDFDAIDAIVTKGTDSKSIMIGMNSSPELSFFTSVGLNGDYTIAGTGVRQNLLSTREKMIRYTGAGDIFTMFQTDVGDIYYRFPFTVNAYSTPPFIYGGIATETTSSGTSDITIGGVVGGYTGLTVNDTLYVGDTFDGQFSTDTALARVGKVISSTEILLGDIT
jgi:hypothetical protein